MIRKLPSGKFRLYSRKKNPKTGKRRNLGTFGNRKAAEKQGAQQAQAADASQASQKIETFKKAMSACLDGRGYSVK